MIQSGVTLLEQLAAASRNGPAGTPSEKAAGATKPGLSIVQRDAKTGETYLKLPMPSPEILDRALQTIGALLVIGGNDAGPFYAAIWL